MAEDKPRLTRLIAILTQLQSMRIVTAHSISEKHKVSIRTVYRDIRTLEQSGIPIFTEEGKGYSLMPGYKLPPVMFTEEEANALITAEHLIFKNKDNSLSDQYQSAITKIKSVLHSNQKEKSEFLAQRIQVRNNRNNEKTSGYLIQLQGTIANFQVVTIDYLSLDKIKTERDIEPFALYTTNDNWILIAFCRKRNDFRAFRLDCIQKLSTRAEKFEPHKITLKQYFEDCRRKYLNTPDIPLSPGPFTFTNNKNNENMEKVKIEPFKVIGIGTRTTNENNQAATDITQLWQRFIGAGLIEKIPNKVDAAIYAIYTDYDSDYTKPYTTFLGCRVTDFGEIPEGLTGRSFKGGTYEKSSARGDLMKGLVIRHWEKIWQADIDRAYTADFEVYGEKAQNPSDAEVDFYIALKE
jgi:predicted DNA-binding transcriptional regulator YafY/predicted transcriptional regulator YdeE